MLPEDDTFKENEGTATTSISIAEKDEMLSKIKYWEDLYGELKNEHSTLATKYEEVTRNQSNNKHSYVTNAELDRCKATQKKIDDALDEFKRLAEEVKSSSSASNKERIEELDQYGRRNILLLHFLLFPSDLYGIDFIEWVVAELNKLFPDLKIPVQLSHIDDAHPMKTKGSDKKIIIVKFANRWMKNEIYKRRAQLKNSSYSNVSITEQLTKHTQSLLDETRTVVGKDTKVFTNNCVISTKFNRKKYHVKNFKDLQFLAKKTGYQGTLVPPGFHASRQDPYYQANNNGSPPMYYNPGHVNSAAAYSMYPVSPYPNNMAPQGRPSNFGRGNGGNVWNAPSTQ